MEVTEFLRRSIGWWRLWREWFPAIRPAVESGPLSASRDHGMQSVRVLAGSRVSAQILITHWMKKSAQI